MTDKKNLMVLIFAGCISVLAFAPFNYSYVIVLSLLLLLLMTESLDISSSKWKLFGYGYLYGLAFFTSQLYWIFYSLYKVIDTGFMIAVLAMIGFSGFLATYIALTVYVYVRLKTKFHLINLMLLFPSVWVFFEWLRGWLLSGFPWCELGYTQASNSFFRGFYPLFGNYAVSWLVLSLTGVVYLVVNAKRINLSKSHLRISIIYCISVFIVGGLIQNTLYTKPYGRPIKVAILQGNVSSLSKWSADNALAIYKGLVEQVQGDLVLIPETAIAQFERFLPTGYLDDLAKIANKKNANLIVGIPKIINKNDDYVNAAMLVSDPAHPYYAKSHLVPYGEYIPLKWLMGPVYKSVALPMVGFSAGDSYQKPMLVANQKLAFNICYENGFNAELIKAAANATLMVNISDMVWYGDSIAKDEHLQLSQVRALENQRYFIQATNTGLSAIIRPDGTIQSVLPIFKREILEDYVGGRTGVTPFEYYGNWVIILWVLLITMVISIYKYKITFKNQKTAVKK